jgi:hypothetical protein
MRHRACHVMLPMEETLPAGTRRGLTSFELVVAFSLLVAAMASTVPIYVRHQRLLAESRRERVAVEELANQAERLRAMPLATVDRYLASPSLSATAQRRLPAARLESERAESVLGSRVILRLFWDDIGRREHPLSLAVWLSPESVVAEQAGPPSEEQL